MKSNDESNNVLDNECGMRLRKCIEEKKMTQRELAAESNFSPQYISNIISGQKPMTVTAAKQFSKILGVRESYLLCESDHLADLSIDQNKKGVRCF